MLENRYEIIWFWANKNRKLSMLEIAFLMGSYDIYDTYKLWIKITIIIVSKETDGGGYWLAKTQNDILQFIKMINARKIGYEQTIDKMEKFLDMKDYENHIPYID